MPCDSDLTSRFVLRANRTIAIVAAAPGTLPGKGVGACLDVMGGAGPDLDFWTCHDAKSPDASHQEFVWNPQDGTLRTSGRPDEAVGLNRTAVNPYVQTPCAWPNVLPRGSPGLRPRRRVVLLENATAIPNFGADTFYPAEDRFGQFVTGFDDGGILGVVAVSNQGARSTTGAAVISGGADWRNLTVRTVNGDRPVPEPAGPMVGRYTSANAAVNGTWWTGTYGLGFDQADDPQRIMMGPFVGFRWSRDGGATWHGPAGHSVANGIFGERPGDAVKMGSPHVVDHGPENRRSPDGALYLVAGGCTAPSATDNCTWISGDGIFVARCTSFDASRPESLNDPACWEFWGGPAMGWVQRIGQARPAFAWKGRVGAVTATLDPRTGKYLSGVTAPNAHPLGITSDPSTPTFLRRTVSSGHFECSHTCQNLVSRRTLLAPRPRG